MPFYISKKVFKQQVKTLVNQWPFGRIKTSYARDLLSRFYGYHSDHNYQKLIDSQNTSLIPVTSAIVTTHYVGWIQKLADLGSMNQIQAKALLHQLWPGYLPNQFSLKNKLYQATIRFHGSCNDFLGQSINISELIYKFDDRPSVKDTIEACGVPHPEVGAIKINEEWSDFNRQIYNDDVINVYPNPWITSTKSLPYKPEGELTFLLDVHLAGLAKYLRLAGFNCLHENIDYGDVLLAALSSQQNYILLTRDIGLLKRSNITYARWVRNLLPQEQFKEIVNHYQLQKEFKPFSRCVKCNGHIHPVSKLSVASDIPIEIGQKFDEFRQCQSCHQVYWKGSHFENIQNLLNEIQQGG